MLKLEITYDFNFQLLGLSCFEPAYRLCWALNKHLGLDLEKSEEDICIFHKNLESFHQFYFYDSLEDDIYYALVKNRGEDGGILIPEYPNIDYFLKIENEIPDEEEFLKKLKKLPWVNGVFQINMEKLKSKENLIFE